MEISWLRATLFYPRQLRGYIWSYQKSAIGIPSGYRKVKVVMWIVNIVLVLGVVLGIIIMVIDNVKKRNIRQRQEVVDAWSRRVNALRSITEKAAVQDLILAGKTLREAGIWFDILRRELQLPDVFWGLENKDIARTLITGFKFSVKDNMSSDEPEDSAGNQQIIDACIEGLIKVLTSRVQVDPKGILEVMNFLGSPGQSPEESIRSLLTIKRNPK